MSITKKLFITTLLTLLGSIIAIEIFNLELFDKFNNELGI